MTTATFDHLHDVLDDPKAEAEAMRAVLLEMASDGSDSAQREFCAALAKAPLLRLIRRGDASAYIWKFPGKKLFIHIHAMYLGWDCTGPLFCQRLFDAEYETPRALTWANAMVDACDAVMLMHRELTGNDER